MDVIAPSILIGSSSNLQVMKTGIKYLTSSIFGQIGLLASELLATECRKNPIGYEVRDKLSDEFDFLIRPFSSELLTFKRRNIFP